MYLISAYFDETTTRALQRFIEDIAAATGNDFMTGNGVPPHLTISALELRPEEEPALAEAVRTLEPSRCEGAIYIAALGQLLPYVMFAAPVLNRYLQELSEEVYRRVSAIPTARVSRFYRPMSWMPHITLGKTLDKEQMQAAFAAMQHRFAPLQGRITSLGLSRTNPYRDLLRIPGGRAPGKQNRTENNKDNYQKEHDTEKEKNKDEKK